jgi:hypothetical protein
MLNFERESRLLNGWFFPMNGMFIFLLLFYFLAAAAKLRQLSAAVSLKKNLSFFFL